MSDEESPVDPQPELADEEPTVEPTVEPKTKVDGRKKPRTPAQIEAFKKAQEAWRTKHKETSDLRKEVNQRVAKHKVEKAKAILEKAKVVLKEPEPEVVLKEPEPQVVLKEEPKKKKSTKKPIVVVEQNSDSESGEDGPNVIYVKKKAKPKKEPNPPVHDVRTPFTQPDNPFGRPYFYNTNGMGY